MLTARPHSPSKGPCTGGLRLVSKAAHLDPKLADGEMDLFDFLDAIEKHSDRENRSASPLLSTFKSVERARKWAAGPKIRSPVKVYRIDTSSVPSDVRLYDMEEKSGGDVLGVSRKGTWVLECFWEQPGPASDSESDPEMNKESPQQGSGERKDR